MGNYDDYTVFDGGRGFERDTAVQNILTKTYMYMFFALLISGFFSYVTYVTGNAQAMIENGTFYPLIIAELVVVFVSTMFMRKNMVGAAAVSFVIYAIINGVTLSFIFLAYQMTSIVSIFFITAGLFGVMAFYGHVTKKDLSSLGSLFLMGLIGIIIVTLVNAFLLKSEGLDLALNYIGVLLFVGLTAYDAQRIKKMATMQTSMSPYSIALLGALSLYLDFINIFLRLLRIFGRRN